MGNRLFKRIIRIINEPRMLISFLKSRLAKLRLYDEYVRKNKNIGIKKLYFVLSFDCDTDQDIEVIVDLVERLKTLGVTPVMAVPGELLKKGQEEYRKVLKLGAEFINHGYKTHSMKINHKYESTYDYYNISLREVENDIKLGHIELKSVLGIDANGFRTPHFGNFQKRKQLRFLHHVLIELGYKYSTSTIPYFGLQYGAILKKFGLPEIPMTGLVSEPLRIYDSFLFYDNDNGCLNDCAYRMEGFKIAEFYQERVANGIINIYADPSQVYHSQEFYRVIERLANCAENVTYTQLLERINVRNEGINSRI